MLEKANFISQLDDEDDAIYIPLFQSFSSCSPAAEAGAEDDGEQYRDQDLRGLEVVLAQAPSSS